MEHGKLNFVQKDGSIFAGAIFMSNRETKLECFQRKLFGLPLSKSKFLKQVKAGMILFLFEHEERKLYGVFEATSDGALNIIPDAFRSTGQSYPAQIIFKRIWMCKPLCEDEFCSAIKENYYSSNKFHFGLSYKQVIKLIHLFYSRRINIQQYKRHGIPNKIIERFEKSAADEVRLSETGTFFKCKSEEYDGEGKTDVRRQLALPRASLDPPVLYKIPDTDTSMQFTVTNTGRVPNQENLCPSSHPHDLYYDTLKSQRCSICLSHDHTAFSHISMGKQLSTTSDIEYKPLPLHMPNLDNVVAPYLNDVTHLSSLDNVACERSCNDPSMIPRIVMIQEEDSLTSLHNMNDLSPKTKIVQHAGVSEAWPNQSFEFLDCIPLVEESQRLVNRENQNSGVENSEYIPSTIRNSCIPSTCNETSGYLYSADEYSYDAGLTYQRVEANEYNDVIKPLYADSDFNRASVFSRLSRSQRNSDQETYEPSGADSSGGLSLGQFLSILSTRRNRWTSMEASKPSMECDSYEPYVSTEHLDHSSGHQNKITMLPVGPLERSEIDQYDGISETERAGFNAALDSNLSNDVVDEESFKLPFYNFRRRNTNQKHEVQDDSNQHGDICGSEAKLMRLKRRRIVRPSLYEEKHQDVKAETDLNKSAQIIEQTGLESSSAQAILESKNERKANAVDSFFDRVVPVLQTVRKYKLIRESLEQNHVISMDGSLDYIPIVNDAFTEKYSNPVLRVICNGNSMESTL